MKQIVLEEPGKFARRDVAEPVAKDGEVIVRVKSIGVCGTDLHAFAGRQPYFDYPRVLGHELGVEIVDPNQSSFSIGDRCSLEPYVVCGKCHSCHLGRSNCCENMQVLGVHVDGGMQPLYAIDENMLYKSDKLSTKQLALVETLSIGLNAVKRSQLTAKQSVLIVGAGPIGLTVFAFAKSTGADVTILELQPSRREFAESIGAKTIEKVEGQLFDVVFDATGNREAMQASFHHVAFCGKLVFVGLVLGEIALPDPLFHRREMTLLASRNSTGLFPEIIAMIESGELELDNWMTHELSLDEIPESFEELSQQKNLVKAIINVE